MWFIKYLRPTIRIVKTLICLLPKNNIIFPKNITMQNSIFTIYFISNLTFFTWLYGNGMPALNQNFCQLNKQLGIHSMRCFKLAHKNTIYLFRSFSCNLQSSHYDNVEQISKTVRLNLFEFCKMFFTMNFLVYFEYNFSTLIIVKKFVNC